MAVTRVLVPFAVGVTVGVLVHKYRHELLELGGPSMEKRVRAGAGLLGRVRAKVWEQGEKFADLVAEIREEEAAAARTPPEPVV